MNLTSLLFKTGALKISAHDTPFFYTSGKIGPFYINTHYLYGSEREAAELLSLIDELLVSDREKIPETILRESEKQYLKNEIYKAAADMIAGLVEESVPFESGTFISGGERRDWFFSYIVSKITGRPHITIFKDRSVTVSGDQDISGKNIVHLCDLTTEASSFKNSWIPAIDVKGARMSSAVTVVDRKQGAKEFFDSVNVRFFNAAVIDHAFFDEAFESGYIRANQLELVRSYLSDQDASMREFLLHNPGFIRKALSSQGKESAKARLMIDKNLYSLPDGFLEGFK